MSDFDEFKSYYALADKLMQAMAPEQLADCLRVLALHLGDYRIRFSAIPGQDLLRLLGTTEISEHQSPDLKRGDGGARWLLGVGARRVEGRGRADSLRANLRRLLGYPAWVLYTKHQHLIRTKPVA